MPTPATLYLSESNGAGPAVTDNIVNINFGGVDLPNVVPGSHPVVKPSGLLFFSYWKSLRPRVFSLGDSVQVQDFRFWKAAGVYLTQEAVVFGTAGLNTYSQPAQSQQPTTSNIPTADPGAANLFTKAPSVSTPITAADGIPFYAPYFYVQWAGNTANTNGTPLGAMNQKTLAFTYAES